jgi:hypothetical protein
VEPQIRPPEDQEKRTRPQWADDIPSHNPAHPENVHDAATRSTDDTRILTAVTDEEQDMSRPPFIRKKSLAQTLTQRKREKEQKHEK